MMTIDEFLDVVKNRRCVRRFKPDPIPDEYVEKILEAARWAMSGANGQPWEFVVVKDRTLRDKLAQLFKGSREHVKPIEESRIKELRHPAFASSRGNPGFQDAPVFIVVCADPRTLQASVISSNFFHGEGGPMAVFFKNMANATQLINLAAAALGLGAQWVSVNKTWEEQAKALLGIPPVLSIHTIVPIGYPAARPSPPYRRRLEEIVHYDTYDKSKYRTGEQVQQFLAQLRHRTLPSYPAEKAGD